MPRSYERMALPDVLRICKPGDLVLFEDKCSCGVCCIACASRSEFNHVGLVYHGASVVPAKAQFGHEMMIELEAPHLLEAVAPEAIAGPLEQVLRSVIQEGGNAYWRSINRPAMAGEPRFQNGGPKFIPRKMRRFGDREEQDKDKSSGSHRSFSMPDGGYDWSTITQNIQSFDRNQPPSAFPASVLPVHSEENGRLLQKLQDYQLVANQDPCSGGAPQLRQLKSPLTFREWNHQCVATIGTPYNTSGLVKQKCCGSCFNSQQQPSEKDLIQSEETTFCSDLVALQMLRAGWRRGGVLSGSFLPRDFAEGQDQLLTGDLQEGVRYGPMVKIFLTASDIALDEFDDGCCDECCGLPGGYEYGSPSETTPLTQRATSDVGEGRGGLQKKTRMQSISP